MNRPTNAQMIGTVLSGRYKLESKLGSGGMSTVFLASDEVLDRQVAIKVLHREVSEQPDQLERFNLEARSVAKVSHPNVVSVIDAGEDSGRPYIVLEYIEGETLKQRIQRLGPLDTREALAYAIEIARGLAVAHARRLVHRDIKPQNVLIDPSGRAKLTDFGISRQLEQEGMTATGRVVGTTDYVAPEQAMGKEVDPRSDIYSLGVVLYEMLTGEVPFSAESQVGVAMKHVTEVLPDVQERRSEASAALSLTVEHATTKDPDERYLHIGAMIEDMETALEVENARASSAASGEATEVIESIKAPGGKPRRGSIGARRAAPRGDGMSTRARWSWLGLALLAAAAAAVLVVTAIVGGGDAPVGGGGAAPEPGQEVALSSATDFDPVGGDGEHPELLGTLTDGNPASTGGAWTTETYANDFPEPKEGVGIVLSTNSPVAATDMEVRSVEPGWSAEVYAANELEEGDSSEPLAGWTRVGGTQGLERLQQIPLDTSGEAYSNYLLWITGLVDDGSGGHKVEITEVRLFE